MRARCRETGIGYGDNGKKLRETERVKIVKVKRRLPPDTKALKYWLKNRSSRTTGSRGRGHPWLDAYSAASRGRAATIPEDTPIPGLSPLTSRCRSDDRRMLAPLTNTELSTENLP